MNIRLSISASDSNCVRLIGFISPLFFLRNRGITAQGYDVCRHQTGHTGIMFRTLSVTHPIDRAIFQCVLHFLLKQNVMRYVGNPTQCMRLHSAYLKFCLVAIYNEVTSKNRNASFYLVHEYS